MSLAARSALYFRYTISAKFVFSPAPSSAKEVSHILQSFRTIAPVEFFHMQQVKFSLHNPFKQIATVVFNASEQSSQLDPFSVIDPELNATPAQLEQRQNELVSYISQICGLPRYSYIENDELYLEGKSQVPFKHQLLHRGHHFLGAYDISPSTVEEPFFIMTGSASAKDVLPHIRHNFQRHHKIEHVFLETGPTALEHILGKPHETDVNVNMNHVIDTAAIMDLEQELPVTSEETVDDGQFKGFW